MKITTIRAASPAVLILLSTFVVLAQSSTAAREKNFPRIAGGVWLTGWPGYDLALTTAYDTQVIQCEEEMIGLPSISGDGELLGAFREAEAKISEAHHPVIAATYSLREKSWRLYSQPIADIGQAAVSPNHASLAYAVLKSDSSKSIELRVVDTKSGSELQTFIVGHDDLFSLSWSPDSTLIAYAAYPLHANLIEATLSYNERVPIIYVLDLKTGVSTRIATGMNPSWSPSGQWIAYFDQSAGAGDYNQVRLIRPNGTDESMLLSVGRWHFLFGSGQRCFRFPPVWSPDSRRLLLNELTDPDKGTFDLQLINISKPEMKRVAKGKPPVLGWIKLRTE